MYPLHSPHQQRLVACVRPANSSRIRLSITRISRRWPETFSREIIFTPSPPVSTWINDVRDTRGRILYEHNTRRRRRAETVSKRVSVVHVFIRFYIAIPFENYRFIAADFWSYCFSHIVRRFVPGPVWFDDAFARSDNKRRRVGRICLPRENP